MRIVIASAFYSPGMGYSENCLSKALARLGHEVHVVCSTYNVYGNEAGYDANYRAFLGPRQAEPGSFAIDGYQVHRLPATLVRGYVRMKGLRRTVARLDPDIVHSIEIASLQTFELAAVKPLSRFKLFSGTSQTMSVMKPYMKSAEGAYVQRAVYRLTRTLPSFLASLAVERVYAVTPDGIEVAVRFYGVPRAKVKLLSLGTDTELFRPAVTESELAARDALRARLGFGPTDIVAVYTGRFSKDKNPLLLARAIAQLSTTDRRFKGLFIGDGAQKEEILACANTVVVPFMTHESLSQHYRAADIAAWPRQESLSMLDAAATALPLIVSDTMGEPERARGNGRTYRDSDVSSLATTLTELADTAERHRLGDAGRRKVEERFGWTLIGRLVEADFRAALGHEGDVARPRATQPGVAV